MDLNQLLPMMIFIPLLAGFALPLLPRKATRAADALSVIVTFLLLFVAIVLFVNGDRIFTLGGIQGPLGIPLVLDGFSRLILLVIAVISTAVTLYSPDYMEKFTSKKLFYSLFFLMIAGMNGVVLTGDLFNLFVFLELASIASYCLVAFGCRKYDLEAAFKYLMLGTIASYFLLLAIVLLYGSMGTLNIAHAGEKIAAAGGLAASKNALYVMVLVLFLAGLGLKAAIVPFHAWLPDAHPSAPTPISAMLSGVLIKAVGVYSLARVLFSVFDLHQGSPITLVLMVLGVVSMTFGGLLAIGQTDFKRMLGYSSVSQIGYIILGLGLATPLGIVAALFHLVNHATFKSLMFLNAGAVEMRTGTREMPDMGGLRERMPVTAATGFVGSMSISGIPPFNGFFSKLLIVIACLQAGQYVFGIIAIVVSFITLGYFLKIQKLVYFGALKEKFRTIREIPAMMALSMILLAVLCLGTSVLIFQGPRDYVLGPAQQSLTNRKEYVRLALPAAEEQAKPAHPEITRK